jgi:hypothetical protein
MAVTDIKPMHLMHPVVRLGLHESIPYELASGACTPSQSKAILLNCLIVLLGCVTT